MKSRWNVVRIWSLASLLCIAAAVLVSCGDNPANPGGGPVCDHIDADGVAVTVAGTPLVTQFAGNVTGGLEAPPGELIDEALVTFLNPDTSAIVVRPECVDHGLRWTVADTAIADISQGDSRWTLDIHGKRVGATTAKIRLWHGDHSDFTSLDLPITVAEEEPIDGAYITFGGPVVWEQWQGVVTGSLSATIGPAGPTGTTTFLGADSVAVGLEPGAGLAWDVADPSKLRIDAVPGHPDQFQLVGLAAGSTTVVMHLLHLGHYDFTSNPIPVTVTANALEPHAVWIRSGCNPVATFGYDASNGPSLATGPILVAPGTTRQALTVGFLNDNKNAIGVRDEIVFPGGYSMDWSVADPAIAGVSPGAGAWDIDIAARAPGGTGVTFRLLHSGTPIYTAGPIPILVATTPGTQQDFVLKKNGIWCVMVQGGIVITSACTRTANPGSMTAAVGELTDLYSIRILDATCTTPALPTGYTLCFDFDDPCIGRIIGHPVHWGEKLIFHLEGMAQGTTNLRITGLANGVPTFVSPPLPVVITAAAS